MTMKVLRPAVANRLLLELICVATHRCGEFGASRRCIAGRDGPGPRGGLARPKRRPTLENQVGKQDRMVGQPNRAGLGIRVLILELPGKFCSLNADPSVHEDVIDDPADFAFPPACPGPRQRMGPAGI